MKVVSAMQRLMEEEGATMVEYAIMGALIAAVCIGIVTSLGQKVLGLFSSVPPF